MPLTFRGWLTSETVICEIAELGIVQLTSTSDEISLESSSLQILLLSRTPVPKWPISNSSLLTPVQTGRIR